jgi:hypothetical protein
MKILSYTLILFHHLIDRCHGATFASIAETKNLMYWVAIGRSSSIKKHFCTFSIMEKTLLGWCTLGCTTFLVPVYSSCTIHRIRKYISKEWSFNLGQNNLLMIGVNHFSQTANKFHLHFRYTCHKKKFKAKNIAYPRVKVYLFWELLGPLLQIWGGKKYIEKDSMSKYSHVFFL